MLLSCNACIGIAGVEGDRWFIHETMREAEPQGEQRTGTEIGVLMEEAGLVRPVDREQSLVIGWCL